MGAWGLIRAAARRVLADRKGGVAIITGLAIPVLAGFAGLGVEVSYWYVKTRDMQNAADAAAIAAARDDNTASAPNGFAYYDNEGRATASKYGFTTGGTVTVTINQTTTCKSGAASCYTATITTLVPQFLTQLVGFKGTTVSNGTHYTALTAFAEATPRPTYCFRTYETTGGVDFTSNGGAQANLGGCAIGSNGDTTCNGSNLSAGEVDVVGTNSGCGTSTQPIKVASPPYTSLASTTNIPADSTQCIGTPQYPQESTHGQNSGVSGLPASNQISGVQTWSGTKYFCGDVGLTNDVTVSNTTIIIYNGKLDLQNHTFNGTNVTLVFSGDNATTASHIPSTTGTLNITAPTSGTWEGFAIYQDPNLTSGLDFTSSGNNPTWNVTGLVYMPYANLTFSGAVNKNGTTCFGILAYSIKFNGTAYVAANDAGCPAGLLPQGSPHLVY